MAAEMLKVQIDMIRSWVERRIPELMGLEDDVVINYAVSQLEQEADEAKSHPDRRFDPKRMQINLTGFLQDKAPQFMLELWRLLLSA